MTIHKLKCWPEFFARIRTGAKKVEIRKNDRDYKVGDELLLEEFVPELLEHQMEIGGRTKGAGYTGESVRAIVTDIVKLDDVPGIGVVEMSVEKEEVRQVWADYVALSLEFPDLEDHDHVFASEYSENILILAKEMERELNGHTYKGDLQNLGLPGGQCLELLRQQVRELEQAMLAIAKREVLPGTVIRKAAGVSNYAMFCVQVCGALQAIKEQKQ